ncbi:MAG: hypothetical protein ACYTHJ_11175 [Planctomycetota bacterium]|jgi:hypothetical protein
MISRHDAIALLNELLALEQRQLSLRLTESTVFVSRMSVEQSQVIRRLNRLAEEHGASLCKAITATGGVPGMRVGDIHTAHLHFQELHHVWPKLIEDYEHLVSAYRLAAERLSPYPAAAKIVGDIHASHQKSVDLFRAAHARDTNETSSA